MAVFGGLGREKRTVGSLALAVGLVLSIVWVGLSADDPSTPYLNLVLADASALPADPVESGAVVDLTAYVLLDSGGTLTTDAMVEFSLRRSDKPEACISKIALVPPSSAWEDDIFAATVSIDTAGLSGGLYEVTAAVRYDGPEVTLYDNLISFGFLSIEDPRPELHPVSLSITPSAPLQWGETATLYSTIENTGRLAAGSFHVVFELRLQPGLQDGSTPKDSVTLEAWSVISTKVVTGLARNSEIQVAASLDLTDPAFGLTQQRIAELGGTDGVAIDMRATVVYTPSSVSELDQTNNSIYGAFSVLPSTLGLPDLVPVSIAYDEDLPVAWDRELAASATIRNIGGSDAPSGSCVAFSYRPSGDQTWHPIRTYPLPAIPVEEDANETTVRVTLIDRNGLGPLGVALEPGEYEIKVEVGCLETIPDCGCEGLLERSVLNNRLIAGFSVRGTELQVESLELSPTVITQGDSVLVRTTVVNTGNREAQEFLVGFYLDGERFDTFRYHDDTGLAEDQRTLVQGVLDTRDLPAGGYDLRVVVDPDNRILEYDDDANNTISVPIEILPPASRRAELQIIGVRLSPSSPAPQGLELAATVTIRNAGEIDAGFFSLSVEYAPCSTECSPDMVDWSPIVLDSNGSETYKLLSGLEREETLSIPVTLATADLAKGSYMLRVMIDADDEISESNESNNTMTVSFSIGDAVADATGPGTGTEGSLPNLTFQNVSVSPSSSVGLGETVTLTASVVNTGGQATGPFSLTLQWTTPTGASYMLLTKQLDTLAPGEAWNIPSTSIQTTLPMGPYTILGTADSNHAVAESNESDNELRVNVVVGQGESIQPDLIISSVRFVPSTTAIESGQEILVYATIQNIGALASGPFAVRVTAGDAVALETWPSLEPLQTVELVHSLGRQTAGSHTVLVEVDALGQVVESNEGNNSLTDSIQVTAVAVTAVQLLVQGQGAVVNLALDASTGTVYAAWDDGTLRSVSREGVTRVIYEADGSVTRMTTVMGVQDVAYLCTDDGRILAVDLASGNLLVQSDEAPGAITVLIAGPSGMLYAASGTTILQFNSALSVLNQAIVQGQVVDLAYEPVRGTLYAATTAGVQALNEALEPQCTVIDFLSSPTALALGSAGVYVGTNAGTVRALTFCQSIGTSGMRMIDAWTYPLAGGAPGSAITSLTLDERDIDPIYATTADGRVLSLSYSGTLQWQYQRSSAGIHLSPTVDPRSGRFVYADDAGVPTILGTDGAPALSIDAQNIQGSAATANVIVDEVRKQTESGMRLVRIYYYCTEDGWISKIESIR